MKKILIILTTLMFMLPVSVFADELPDGFETDIDTLGALSGEDSSYFNKRYSTPLYSITTIYEAKVGTAQISTPVNNIQLETVTTINFNQLKSGYIDLLGDINTKIVDNSFNFIVENATYEKQHDYLSSAGNYYHAFRLKFNNVSCITIRHSYSRSQLSITSSSLNNSWYQDGYKTFRPVCKVNDIHFDSIASGSDYGSTLGLIYESINDNFYTLLDIKTSIGNLFKPSIDVCSRSSVLDSDNLNNIGNQYIVEKEHYILYSVFNIAENNYKLSSGQGYVSIPSSRKLLDFKVARCKNGNIVYLNSSYNYNDNYVSFSFLDDSRYYDYDTYILLYFKFDGYTSNSNISSNFNLLYSNNTSDPFYHYVREEMAIDRNNQLITLLNNYITNNDNSVINNNDLSQIYNQYITINNLNINDISSSITLPDINNDLPAFQSVATTNLEVMRIVSESKISIVLIVSLVLGLLGVILC